MIEYSTAFRNLLQGFCSKKRLLTNGVFRIYDGTPPDSPDYAATGTMLCQITLSSGAWTPEVLSYGQVTLSGTGGQVDSVTVNSVELLNSPIVYLTSLTVTAALVASAINRNITNPKYIASSSGAVATIKALPGTGISPNTWVVACTVSGGTLAKTVVAMSGGVAPVNGLTFDEVIVGVLEKIGVWSGVNSATGTASYFRMTSSVADNDLVDAAPWTKPRMQGTCGQNNADYIMGSTSMTIALPHVMETWIETLSE